MSVFIVPDDNLESHQIITMLEEAGYNKGWGILIPSEGRNVTDKTLDREIKGHISMITTSMPQGLYCIDIHLKYGITITHDNFRLRGSRTTIEKVAELLGHEMTEFEKFVSANARGGIPAMAQMAAKQGKDMDTTKQMIDSVRSMDRTISKITTDKEEIQAEEAIGKMEKFGNLVIVDLPHNKYQTVTDRFWPGQNVLAVCADGNAYFTGDRTECAMLEGRLQATAPEQQDPAVKTLRTWHVRQIQYVSNETTDQAPKENKTKRFPNILHFDR